eukprot:Sspe_Gene.69009::Locus_40670_Transcript_1_1_Confidence_1.000_Length_929::g.69009::m.69009/K15382/SLC50A, SWEET; solute carrier family 50 (sugar transporter)
MRSIRAFSRGFAATPAPSTRPAKRVGLTGGMLAALSSSILPTVAHAAEAEAASAPAKIAAAKAAYGATTVGFLQVAPPFAAQFLFFSPLATIREVQKAGTTGKMPMLPYTMMACNGFLWMTYGVLTGDMTLIAANMSALVMGSYYCMQFLKYKAPETDVKTPIMLAGSAALAVTGMAAAMPTAQAIDAIGMTGCAVVVAMFGGPLSAIQTVLKEKSTASLPFPMAIATTINCTLWLAYGWFVLLDPYIWGPNGLGLLSGVVQLLLFARFGFAKAKKM